MEITVITYNAPGAVASGGPYEYPRPSSKSVATTNAGAPTAHKRVKITLPKATSRQSKKKG